MNDDVVRAMYDAIAGADIPAFTALLDADVRWTVPGNHALAGTFEGVPALLAHLAEVFQATGGHVVVDVRDVVSGDHFTVAVVDVRMTVDGVTVDDSQVHLFEVSNGRITSVREYHGDEAAFARLFSA